MVIIFSRAKKIGITSAVYNEVIKNDDEIATWLKQHKKVLHIDDSELFQSDSLRTVLEAYGKNSPSGKLSEIDLEKISTGADLYIIAFALLNGHTVVSNEVLSRGPTIGKNRKIPDVCLDLKINCINDRDFMKKFKFSTYLRRNN